MDDARSEGLDSRGDAGSTADAGTRLQRGWAAWRNGAVADAANLAMDAAGDGAAHLRFLAHAVRGDYTAALAQYESIDGSYARLSELDRSVVDVFLHLGQVVEALDFATKRGLSDTSVAALELRAATPFSVELDGPTTIEFADHPLTPYLPGFDIEIRGEPVIAHMDTGGTYLVMSPARAEGFGIELTTAGQGMHGSMATDMSVGTLSDFQLGAARFRNVPVITLASLTGQQDLVIFGTNILEPFLTTFDYPAQRLTLVPRSDPQAVSGRLKELPQGVEVPFFLWDDHYMFARGALGDHDGLNFFVDSGLVMVQADEQGVIRQAGFLGTSNNYLAWGVAQASIDRGTFTSAQPLSLGAASVDDVVLAVGTSSGWNDLGGVRIDGLISHAFLQQHVWTIDFDTHLYHFSPR